MRVRKGANLMRLLRFRALQFKRNRTSELEFGHIARILDLSESVPGWTRGAEAMELLLTSHSLPKDGVAVEIGSFLGSATILLAGARRLRGNGVVHCVDPFDASGDSFSVPYYRDIANQLPFTLRQQFDDNIRAAGVSEYVVVHPGTAESIGPHWSHPIDLLFLDGDHSPAGAESAFRLWIPHLRSGGILALHNSVDDRGEEGHDGFRKLARRELKPTAFTGVYRVGTTTFARKL